MHKPLILLMLLSDLSACGKLIEQGPDGAAGLIGSAGHDGADGKDGTTGPTGSSGSNGVNGATGAQGISGVNGTNGHSSLIHLMPAALGGGLLCGAAGGVTLLTGLDLDDSGTLEASEVSASADICNGTSATVSSFTPVAIIDPCGTAPGVHNEVFVRLQNGSLLASFSATEAGKDTRFSLLTPGNYMTTDGDACYFTIDAGLNIVNERH